LVTADGSVNIVNEVTNPDLFWGIRGGGSNFGVVTEFVLRLHPQRSTVFAGPLVFLDPPVEKIVGSINEWYKSSQEDEGIHLIFGFGPNEAPVLVVVVFYNGEEEEGRKRFQFLVDLGERLPCNHLTKPLTCYSGPAVNGTGSIPYEKLNASQNNGIPR